VAKFDKDSFDKRCDFRWRPWRWDRRKNTRRVVPCRRFGSIY